MKTHSRWRVWIAPVLILLMGAGYLLSQRATAPQGRRGRQGLGGAIPVAVAEVTKGNMGEYIYALGTVTSVYTVSLTSRVAGELVEIHYKEGQLVKKGDLLAVIDPRPYMATYTQAQGQLQRDQALLQNARTDLQRYQMAYTTHAIPEQTVVTQQATVNQEEGTVKVDEGSLEAAKINLDYTRITSPIDGRVGLRGVDLGNIVQANGATPLVTITQLQPITVIFTMAENYVDEVYNQMRTGHKLRVDALNRDDQSELAQGSVLALDSQIDTTTGTVRVRAIFPNKNNRLFPNEFVNARLLVRTLMGVNIIPNAAIQRNNEVAYVYVVNPDSTVKSQNVTVATTDGTSSAVTGVTPGQRVVTDGFDKLQDGAKITVRGQYTPTGEAPGGKK
ncbi:MAG TPA: efflux RND transporter periplasmic adaptor subunit [Bryobacteraceae bacterium]|nr:efflux RND transporter periplasmic adaptor subunit [Bryobacteraceae bacterium]